jgi:hypothetical protein
MHHSDLCCVKIWAMSCVMKGCVELPKHVLLLLDGLLIQVWCRARKVMIRAAHWAVLYQLNQFGCHVTCDRFVQTGPLSPTRDFDSGVWASVMLDLDTNMMTRVVARVW